LPPERTAVNVGRFIRDDRLLMSVSNESTEYVVTTMGTDDALLGVVNVNALDDREPFVRQPERCAAAPRLSRSGRHGVRRSGWQSRFGWRVDEQPGPQAASACG
jgi:hypothetical protein